MSFRLSGLFRCCQILKKDGGSGELDDVNIESLGQTDTYMHNNDTGKNNRIDGEITDTDNVCDIKYEIKITHNNFHLLLLFVTSRGAHFLSFYKA